MYSFDSRDVLDEGEISREAMAQFLSYDNGFLIWKARTLEYYNDAVLQRRWNAFYAGQRAGSLNKQGYITVRVLGKSRNAHRVTWLLFAALGRRSI